MCCAYNNTDSLLACTKHTHTNIYAYTHTHIYVYAYTRSSTQRHTHAHASSYSYTHALKRWPKHIGTRMYTITCKNIQPINTKICVTQLAKFLKPKLIWI